METGWCAEVPRFRAKSRQATCFGRSVGRRRVNRSCGADRQWLFISGQEEYTNPFTGQTDIDTSYYPYRWMNKQGDVIYADENSFDPNELEEYKTREWKRSPTRQR
jgi:hypothetical protein